MPRPPNRSETLELMSCAESIDYLRGDYTTSLSLLTEAFKLGLNASEQPHVSGLRIETHSYLIFVSDDIHDGRNIEIRRVLQRGGGWKWRISRASEGGGSVLNSDFEWEFERLPSSRTPEDLARTRYDSLEEAIAHVKTYLSKESANVPIVL